MLQETNLILIVDDDSGDRLLLEKALRETGVINPIATLNNGEELLNYLFRKGEYASPERSLVPCLIFLDISMPKVSGSEVIKTIRNVSELASIPIIVLTNFPKEGAVDLQAQPTITPYIGKPKTYEGLLDLVRSITKYSVKIRLKGQNQ